MTCEHSCEEHCYDEDGEPLSVTYAPCPRKVTIQVEICHNWGQFITAEQIATQIDAFVDRDGEFLSEYCAEAADVPDEAWEELYDSKYKVTTRVMQSDFPMLDSEVQAIA